MCSQTQNNLVIRQKRRQNKSFAKVPLNIYDNYPFFSLCFCRGRSCKTCSILCIFCSVDAHTDRYPVEANSQIRTSAAEAAGVAEFVCVQIPLRFSVNFSCGETAAAAWGGAVEPLWPFMVWPLSCVCVFVCGWVCEPKRLKRFVPITVAPSGST